MAVKKSYIFNKIIQKIEKETLENINLDWLSKLEKKKLFINKFFPLLSKNNIELFYKQSNRNEKFYKACFKNDGFKQYAIQFLENDFEKYIKQYIIKELNKFYSWMLTKDSRTVCEILSDSKQCKYFPWMWMHFDNFRKVYLKVIRKKY